MPDGCHLRFEKYLQGKNTCSSDSMILHLCRLTGKCFEETLRGGNDVKNLEIFSMNNKTTIDFGFRLILEIMQFSESRLFSRSTFQLLDLHNCSEILYFRPALISN